MALVAGSGNVTGLGVIEALSQAQLGIDHFRLVAGYDCCEIEANAANMFCTNYKVPRASDPQYSSWVMMLVHDLHPQVIIPSNDHDLRVLLTFESELNAKGVILNGTCHNTTKFQDKLKTSYLFTDLGIQTPQLLSPTGYDYPYVVRKNRVGTGKKFSYMIRNNKDEANVPEDPSECVFTRLIEGQEYTIDIVCSQKSDVLAVIPRLRRRVTAGIVTFAEVVKDDLIIKQATDLAKKCQLRGINCVQCIRNDHGCFFFEVNPRPGSGTSLTTKAGVNMPELWIQSLYGTVSHPEPKWGLKMVRYYAGHYFT